MRTPVIILLASAVLAAIGCGDADRAGLDRRPVASTPAGGARDASPSRSQDRTPPPKHDLIVFRRIRFEGATLRILTLHDDGTIDIKIPNGGAGGSLFDGRVTPSTLKAIKRLVHRTPWDDLSAHKVVYDRSGAYFMLRHAGKEHIAMADGMSKELVPLVDRLNGILNGRGRAEERTIHRFLTT